MLQNGVELAEVSRVLGHSSVVTTKRYYSVFMPKTQPIPAQPVEFALNGGV
jgi:site-specific recombinase XerD